MRKSVARVKRRCVGNVTGSMGRMILLTGMSGTGKSTALSELRRRGYQTVDTDEAGLSEWSDPLDGCTVSNQGRLYERFDAVVLLSAPADVLLERIERRTTNDYGKRPQERELILEHLATVEPLLRASCTHEIDAACPIEEVVNELLAIGAGV